MYFFMRGFMVISIVFKFLKKIIIQFATYDYSRMISPGGRERIFRGDGWRIHMVFFTYIGVMASATTSAASILEGAMAIFMPPPVTVEAATGLSIDIEHLQDKDPGRHEKECAG